MAIRRCGPRTSRSFAGRGVPRDLVWFVVSPKESNENKSTRYDRSPFQKKFPFSQDTHMWNSHRHTGPSCRLKDCRVRSPSAGSKPVGPGFCRLWLAAENGIPGNGDHGSNGGVGGGIQDQHTPHNCREGQIL